MKVCRSVTCNGRGPSHCCRITRRGGRQRDHRQVIDAIVFKYRTQALLCLARRRADVLFALLRDGTFNEPQPVRAVAPQT